MKKWIYVGIVICIVAWPFASTKAQDGTVPPLTQIVTLQSDVGQMTMQFPFGWRSGNPLEVDATYVEIDNGTDTTPPTVAVEAIIAPFDSLPIAFDTRSAKPAETYFEAFRTQRFQNRYGVYGNVVPALFGPSLNPYTGTMMMLLENPGTSEYLSDERVISIGVGIDIAENTLLLLSFQSSVEEFEGWRDTWLAMLDTLKWNDTLLLNTTSRQRTANLEDSATMVNLYDSQFPEVATTGNVSTLAAPIVITSDAHSLSFFPPNHWQHTLDDGLSSPVILSPIGSTTAFAAVRWVPAGTAYGGLVLHDEALSVARWLLGIALVQEIRSGVRGGVTQVTTFDWNGYPAAAVGYQFASGVPNIRYLIAVPDDGFVEITLQALPTEWVQIGIDFDYILSSLTLDDVSLDSEAAREVRQELSVQ